MQREKLLWIPAHLLLYVKVWRQSLPWIIGFTLLVATIVGIWQYLQPNQYLCEVEFVPPSTFHLSTHPPQVVPGSTIDLERFYTYLQSPVLWGAVVDSFRLIEHYNLAKIKDPLKLEKALRRELSRRSSYRITNNSTLYLSFLDENPDYAYRIVNFILDKIKEELDVFTHESKIKQGVLLEEEVAVDKRLREVQEQLAALRRMYKYLPVLESNTGRINLAPQGLLYRDEMLTEYLAHYDEMITLERELHNLTQLKIRFSNYRTERSYYLSIYKEKLWLIVRPTRPTAPAYPRPLRWIVLSGLFAFTLSSLLVIYLYHMRRLSEKELFEKVS
ncbi:MAG: hypothetical protein N3E49_04670 [Bacteroidia bacterium]|nr:hypothetical protein [Bacteroidia bacterium]